MKIYIMFLLIVILFNACASKSAFDKFHITKKQKISIEQTQTSKIKNENNTTGIVTALYLNNVDKKKFYKDEYFYISLFIQGSNGKDIQFLLNSQEPIQIKTLPNPNKFTKLTSINTKWLKYYLVRFNKIEDSVLKLKIIDNNNSSRLMLFQNLEFIK